MVDMAKVMWRSRFSSGGTKIKDLDAFKNDGN
jgi:hypothetical protein